MESPLKHRKPHACAQCGKSFARKAALHQHLPSHTGERKYGCSQCSKRFLRRTDRDRHERLQHSEKKFQCGGITESGAEWGCGKAFARPDALADHFKSESGQACLKSKEKSKDGSSLSGQLEDHNSALRSTTTSSNTPVYVSSAPYAASDTSNLDDILEDEMHSTASSPGAGSATEAERRNLKELEQKRKEMKLRCARLEVENRYLMGLIMEKERNRRKWWGEGDANGTGKDNQSMNPQSAGINAQSASDIPSQSAESSRRAHEDNDPASGPECTDISANPASSRKEHIGATPYYPQTEERGVSTPTSEVIERIANDLNNQWDWCRPIICLACWKGFSKLDALRDHFETHLQDYDKIAYPCWDCRIRFQTLHAFMGHWGVSGTRCGDFVHFIDFGDERFLKRSVKWGCQSFLWEQGCRGPHFSGHEACYQGLRRIESEILQASSEYIEWLSRSYITSNRYWRDWRDWPKNGSDSVKPAAGQCRLCGSSFLRKENLELHLRNHHESESIDRGDS